jgi:hypothetical protein
MSALSYTHVFAANMPKQRFTIGNPAGDPKWYKSQIKKGVGSLIVRDEQPDN